MDLDKSLDEQIADKRKSQPRKAPRQSRERREPAPYARPPPRSTEDKWVHDAYAGPGRDRRAANGGGAGGGRDVAAVAGTGAGFTGVSPRIEIIGLHYEVTPSDLKNIFSKAGTIVQGPTIRYDRSGRSKGEATLEYASYQQAKVAINQFDGAMTKGQTISIRLLPPVTQRLTTPSLAARVSGPSGGSLLSRLSGGAPAAAPSAPRVERGGRGGRVGAARGRGAGNAGGGRGGKRGPANAGDLDNELDSFMKNDSVPAGDVDMA